MRKLTECDRERLFEYLSLEPEYNIYLIGDINAYGFASDTVEVFAKEKNGMFDSVLMRYCTSYVLYAQEASYDVSAVFESLKDKTIHCISGKSQTLRRLQKFFPDKVLHEMTLMKLTKETLKPCEQAIENVSRLGASDLESIRQVYIASEEFREKYCAPNGMEKLNTEFYNGRYYGKIAKGKIVATATLSAENGPRGMLDNVVVIPEQQRRGYGYEVVYSLCRDFLNEGKSGICVFFSSEYAEKIYLKTGFEYLGKYALLK